MGKIQKVILNKEGDIFYVRDTSSNYHTRFGFISVKDLKKKGKAKTNTGKDFFIFDAGFADRFKRIKRGAQIITLKDAGVIISETGIGKESKVVDIGGGSGALACVLGNIAKQVITYEINKDFAKVIDENVRSFGLQNVKVKNKDALEGLSEKNIDLITVDLPEPSLVMASAANALKKGGFFVCYLPSMTQVISVANDLREKDDFIVTKVCETLQREWKVEGKIARPEFQMLGHTGFLVFARRV